MRVLIYFCRFVGEWYIVLEERQLMFDYRLDRHRRRNDVKGRRKERNFELGELCRGE